MAKDYYKIPADLDTGYLDREISLGTMDGANNLRPVSIKVVLSYIFSGFLAFWFVTQTFMSHSPIWLKLLFFLFWGVLTHLLASYTKRKDMQITLVEPFFNYIFSPRRLSTRSTDKANDFYGICGIAGLAEDDRLIEYADGTVAYAYQIVGSASRLLFEEDRDLILRRTDGFFRKLGNDYELIIITTRESQKVYKQVAALQSRYNNLKVDEPDLENLLEQQFQVFKSYIGSSFRSIHQYLFIKANNKEALRLAENVLRSEVENSALYLKQCTALFEQDIYSILEPIYQEDIKKK